MGKPDDFQAELIRFTNPGQTDRSTVIAFAQWLNDSGVHLFKEIFEDITEIQITNKRTKTLVQQAYAKSPGEHQKMMKKGTENKKGKKNKKGKIRRTGDYWSANAQMFMWATNLVAPKTITACEHPSGELFVPKHYRMLQMLTRDAMELIRTWSMLNGTTPPFSIGKAQIQHALEMYHAAQQMFFGGSPFFAHTDVMPEASIGILRIAIETRIRYGFGTLGLIKKDDQSLHPLPLSTILERIKKYADTVKDSSHINFAIPIEDISRLYRWCNVYTHAGVRPFIWTPMLALHYVRPLLCGKPPSKHRGDVRSGIQARKEAVLEIQRDIEAITAKDGKYSLQSIPPEYCELVLLK